MEVLIGVDPHKVTNTAAAVGGTGELLEHATFSASRQGLRSLRAPIIEIEPLSGSRSVRRSPPHPKW
jgi:hypothetical protein